MPDEIDYEEATKTARGWLDADPKTQSQFARLGAAYLALLSDNRRLRSALARIVKEWDESTLLGNIYKGRSAFDEARSALAAFREGEGKNRESPSTTGEKE